MLPLHRTPRSVGQPFRGPVVPGVARNVNIRPASMEGLLSLQFDIPASALAPDNDVMPALLLSPTSATPTPRHHLRARSNSMPVSMTTSMSLPPAPTSMSTPKPASTRRSRTSSTPRSRTARRYKGRSKSESLQEMGSSVEEDSEIRRPSHDRSQSDSVKDNRSMLFDWSLAVQGPTYQTKDDDEFDDEIWSLLANYDTSDSGDSPVDTPSSTIEAITFNSHIEDGIEPIGNENAGFGSFSVQSTDVWMTTRDDALLSSCLQRMTMVQDTNDMQRTNFRGEFEVDPKLALSTPHSNTLAHPFDNTSIESFTIAPVEPLDQAPLHSISVPSETQISSTMSREEQPLAPKLDLMWTKGLTTDTDFSAQDIDQGMFMDDVTMAPSPCDVGWKVQNPVESHMVMDEVDFPIKSRKLQFDASAALVEGDPIVPEDDETLCPVFPLDGSY
ncbi:hypothetical protein PINS_up005410 [Pythium insidiosum]|nr:hypothetical protein PINS_up005410 [Pythium insidiosum]